MSYVWLRIEPSVEYQHSAPAFLLSHSFFKSFPTWPGGLTDYGTAFLAQLSANDLLGGLSFTLIGILVFLATRKVLCQINGAVPGFAPFVPPFVLLLLRERFYSPASAIDLGLLLSLGLATGYGVLPSTRTWLRLAACWMGSALLFYVAGAWPCVLFVVLCALFHVPRRRQWVLGLGCALSLLVLPVGMLISADTIKALNRWGNAMSGSVLAGVYLFFSIAAVVLALVPPASEAKAEASPARRKATRSVPARSWFQTDGAKQAFAWSFLLLGWVVVWLAFDDQRKALAQVDCYSSRKEYDKVLAAAARIKTMNPPSEVRLHQALYHTGRLGEDLFSFTNQTVWDLMPALRQGLNACRPQSESLMELGQVNLAEHFAQDALEWEGERPDILRLLAQINIIEGRPRAAHSFLSVLRLVPFQEEWAGAYHDDLEADPRLPHHQELAPVLSLRVTTDLPHPVVPNESILRQSLEANRRNQMAFEYLMAHFLLTRRADKIADEIGRLNDFEYVGIPRHYEEAILLQESRSGTRVNLRGRQIRPETLRRFEGFAVAMQNHVNDSPEGRQALARDFGDTFWYHFISGRRTPSDFKEDSRQQ